MHPKEVTESHRRLLGQLSRRISKRLKAEFTARPGKDGSSIGVQLSEHGRTVVMALPAELLKEAERDVSAREAIRVRIKTRRDRMLFRRETISLTKRARTASRPPSAGFGHGRGRG